MLNGIISNGLTLQEAKDRSANIQLEVDGIVGRIAVKETKIDYNGGIVCTPFHPPFPTHLHFPHSPFNFYLCPFSEHCKEVYGLNNKEIEYLWDEYKDIINNKNH